MSELKFIQVQKDNPQHCEVFKDFMLPYNRELGANKPDGTPYSDEFLLKWIQSCIDMQGQHDRHMELVYVGDEPIGFLYGKVDHEGHKGFIKPEYGYIMEFYVKPEHRRKGYAKEMFRRLERHFSNHGAKRMYLTTGVSGESFWRSMGFIPTGEVSPENNMQIYEKDVSLLNVKPMQNEHIDFVISILTSDKNRATLHPDNKSVTEWHEVFTRNLADSDEANFVFCEGDTPVAWLKLNGLQSKKNMVWIPMLVVHEKYQRQGIGGFAVRFAEDFVWSKGFKILGIHTTVDNVAAQNCYKKLGYHVHDEGECTTGDGVKRRGLSLSRDNLDAVRMNIDGVSFHVGEQHDFSFIKKIGRVFRVFDAMDSGNICFGVERDDKRYFVKYAGARTQNYDGEITDAIIRLQTAVKLYENLQHPHLIRLVEHYSVGDGYIAIFDWVNGEGLRSYWDYVGSPMWSYSGSPNYRFRHLPIQKRIAVVDIIMAFHQHVVERGYIPVDFYDGSMIYDFNSGIFHICDIDFYRKAPTKNDMGKMWGSGRFMSPEEYELGAALDEKTVVYLMGAAAFELLSNDTEEAYQAWENGKLHRSFNAWSTTKALFDVAIKAASMERNERYNTITELLEAWNAAKVVDNIQYRQLSLDDISPDMLLHFNRFQEVKKSWRKQNGEWVLVDTPFIDNWDESKKRRVGNEDFPDVIRTGGFVFGAFDTNKLIGFAVVPSALIGKNKQYIQLDNMQVSFEYRHKGIGRVLFQLSRDAARTTDAKKLYISAQSSQESQAFYRSMGCVDAEEIIPELFEAEPYDVHMEYLL